MNIVDQFLPAPDIREEHEIDVRAEPSVVFRTACAIDLNALPLARAIFRLRQVLMRSSAPPRQPPGSFVAQTIALGWGKLLEQDDRALVMGAVTRPWEADVTFRSIEPDRFAAFDDPGLVKIVWTLEAEPQPDGRTRLRTQTRAAATDELARKRFLRYWRWARFGIIPIRWILLPAVKRAAERRAAAGS